ncbi:MAG: BON domain-containing protein [Dysgonamonadaceae bacterium]|jgi:uncharacterized protein YgiM (DUF1202 family)|nr:BON domain-containing protein [Dysgonamonadaceae bacterium]MDD3356242.1 BON domain-containing protein [Dysgonamonadaceae bacterium]MDD3727370.1 BON domain-containing protein [Dysgonamonadaceae bacterium]MDD4246315.1 BON domain-containing protein [Dysgonamonadaceae bacterium]MDD4605666.1 BON domain-containing protein [Dysgonamonadaceae bacterium]
MKKVRFLILTLIFFLSIGFVGCDNVKDSDLQDEAVQLIATNPKTSNVNVTVIDKVATLSGTVEDDATKNSVQSSVLGVDGINSIVNNIQVVPPPPKIEEPVVEEVSNQVKVATRKGKLNIHNRPGVQEHVIAVVEHGEMLTLVEKVSDDWWLIQTENGVEGYSYAPYLEQQ